MKTFPFIPQLLKVFLGKSQGKNTHPLYKHRMCEHFLIKPFCDLKIDFQSLYVGSCASTFR